MDNYNLQWYKWLTLKGKTNDLLSVSNDGSMKMTRLFGNLDGKNEEKEEVFDVSITSTNPSGRHPMFDELEGKNIRITIEVEAEDGSASWWLKTGSRKQTFYC